jgi:RNA polymerase sigma-70 factor (ECF subfamily)
MDRDSERRTDMSPTASMTLPAPDLAPAASFDVLYRSTVKEIHAYVTSLLRDRAAAEDVTAQTFEKALRRQSSFNPGKGTQRAWLFTIARNAALDELRRRRRTVALVSDPAAVDAQAAAPEEDERLTTLRAALDGLDPRDRELIALKFHAGLSNTEIARVLDISVANAGTRAHRAMTRLREACHAAP